MEDRVLLAVFSVTDTGDAGAGTLRQAILDANSNPGADSIEFAIPGGGPYSIDPLSALPTITDTVVIDATTQPGYAGTPVVKIDGSAAGANVDGITLGVGSDGSTIRGLLINRFDSDGIWIDSGSNTIQGNYIGTNFGGTTAAPNGRTGIVVNVSSSGGNQIGGTGAQEGNLISGNLLNGIGLNANNDIVEGNLIGTDVNGTSGLGNASGIFIGNGASGNQVRGGNVISANLDYGILITGAGTTGNVVAGNLIGTSATGLAGLGNALDGIRITSEATNNRIGTDGNGVNDAAERNVISGNGSGTQANVNITGIGTTGNIVAGNSIGTTINGDVALANSGRGVRIAEGASFNRIGTDGSNDAFNAAERNVISGHTGIAVFVVGGSNDNIVAGNYVGLNAAGTAALGNTVDGITLDNVTRTQIGTNGDGVADAEEANVVAGSGGFGILVSNGATLNDVAGNRVGTNAAGTAALPNALGGIVVAASATENTIGGTTAAAGNLVSGNTGPGIWVLREYNSVTYPASPDNSILSNLVGTDVTGTTALGNSGNGIVVEEPGTIIGAPGAGNLISGNGASGIWITRSSASGVIVRSNLIGTNAAGTAAIGNFESGVLISDSASLNLIGGSTPADRNVISGNNAGGLSTSAGVAIIGSDASNNSIQGNYIGLDWTGTVDLGNGEGIYSEGANTTIGGMTATPGTAPGNVISGNGAGPAWLGNIRLRQSGAAGTHVLGNLIGTDVSGMFALDPGNSQYGVYLQSTHNVVVGGTTETSRNVISGHTYFGVVTNNNSGGSVVGNRVSGNYIGTSLPGTSAVANRIGVVLSNGSTDNTVGGGTAAERNVISGNTEFGIHLNGNNVLRNIVAGNFVGTTASGTQKLGNGSNGIEVSNAVDSVIGTNGDGVQDSGEGNLISGNSASGVWISGETTDRTVVAGNLIGLDATGSFALGNNGVSVGVISGPDNTRIGTDGNGVADADERNVISGNLWEMLVEGPTTDGTIIAGNYIGTNAAGNAAIPSNAGITLRYGPQNTRIGTDGSNDAFNESERNVISGNNWVGIHVTTPYFTGLMPAGGVLTDGTVIAGNYIGLDATGTAPIGNQSAGVYVTNMTRNTRVGTNGDGIADELERNVISGNGWRGIQVEGWAHLNVLTTEQLISGDIPSTSVSATVSHADFYDTSNGNNGNWRFNNPIPGGGGEHYALRAVGLLNVTTAGTYTFALGTDNGGRLRIDGSDVVVDDAAHAFTDVYQTITLSSGVHSFELIGFETGGAAAFEVAVKPGTASDAVTEANGWRVLGAPNPHSGIALQGTIDVTAYYPDPGDLQMTIAGNYIGTDVTGNVDLGNANDGITLWAHATGVTIGGSQPQMRNVISGNGNDGIEPYWGTTRDVKIQGNYIGVGADGETAIGNDAVGIRVNRSQDITIGTDGDGIDDVSEGNVISANGSVGIYLYGDRTQIDNLAITDQVIAGQVDSTIATGMISQTDIRDLGGPAGNWGTDNLVPGGGGDDYVLRATGSFSVSTAGDYSFSLGGDDGGRLLIDGAVVVEDDTLHGFLEYYGTVTLSAGEHTFEWVMMERWYGAGWELAVKQGAHSSGPASAANGWSLIGDPAGPLTVTDPIDVTVWYLPAPPPATPSVIAGNLIGTNAAGTVAMGNGSSGILLQNGMQDTRIGTNGDGVSDLHERNVIADSFYHGVEIQGDKTTGTIIAGNYLGTDITGTVDLGNHHDGIAIWHRASNTRVGTDGSNDAFNAAESNLISGNDIHGVFILNPEASNNIVAGNLIGTDASGTADLGNTQDGVRIVSGAHSNRIGTDGNGIADTAERNVISGNGVYGVSLHGASTDNNVIAGNFIGTDITGTLDLGNADRGILADNGPGQNRIGTDGNGVGDEDERNIISGNDYQGIFINGSGTDGNIVAGNFVGTDVSGTLPLGNLQQGIRVSGGARNTVIGTNGDGQGDASEGNVVASSQFVGIIVTSSGTQGTIIAGNMVGTDRTGTIALGNAGNGGIRLTGGSSSTRVGTNADGVSDWLERNVVSANLSDGIELDGSGTSMNTVAGNYVGVNALGSAALGNSVDGIQIRDGATQNVIGGTAQYTRNVVAGNSEHGIRISGIGASDNWILGNYVGLNATGNGSIPNMFSGIAILAGADGNLIGTNGDGVDDSLEANVVSGNALVGVWISGPSTAHNHVAGNLIGTDAAGTTAVPNAWEGVAIGQGAQFNIIGTNNDGVGDDAERNLISGNLLGGVTLGRTFSGDGTWFNVVAGNYIGTDRTGTQPLPNQVYGVGVTGAAEGNLIAGNLISGNNGSGVTFDNSGQPAIDLLSGQLGVWRAEGDASDSFGNNDGTIFNGVTFAPGIDGQAFLISGSDGSGPTVSVPSSSAIDRPGVTNQITMSAWVNWDGKNTENPIIRRSLSIEPWDIYGLTLLESGQLSMRVTDGVNSNQLVAPSSLTAGQWYHVAGTYDGSSNRLFVNGLLVAESSATVDIAESGVPLNIGSNGHHRFGGLVDSVTLYERALNLAELQLLAAVDSFGGSNRLQNNRIGTDVTGTAPLGNQYGVVVAANTQHIVIGTDSDGTNDAFEGNIISGNTSHGVLISGVGANASIVAGNLIGVGVTGTSVLANGGDGVQVNSGAGNLIGGSTSAARNVISGNVDDGVHILGSTATGNRVQGNAIGTDITGLLALGNSNMGIEIRAGAHHNVIGTDGDGSGDATEGNVISANRRGIQIGDTGAESNVVAGNLIGTNVHGTSALPNELGVFLFAGALYTRIGTDSDGVSDQLERNLISGNVYDGVNMNNADQNVVAGNFIGTDITGTAAIPNGDTGVAFYNGAAGNRIGSNADGIRDNLERNLVSGNANTGVWIYNVGTSGNVVAGNDIGTDVTGSLSLPNGQRGVLVFGGASNNDIGLPGTGGANVISGNTGYGILITRDADTITGASPASGNRVRNNLIGLRASGTGPLPNSLEGVRIDSGAFGNTIGGSASGAGNVISGNLTSGVLITGVSTDDNRVQGNRIGTSRAGNAAVPNAVYGIHIESGAAGTLVGGATAGTRNTISGNTFSGVAIVGAGTGTRIQGNFIGTDATGSLAVGNASTTTSSAAGVLVTAMNGTPVFIGTDGDGASDATEGNVISGNFRSGVRIQGGSDDSGSHVIAGNLIGTDASGTRALPNQGAGVIVVVSSDNIIGTNSDGISDELERNVISGNRNPGGHPEGPGPVAAGVVIIDPSSGDGLAADSNVVAGNFIGTDRSGVVTLGNQGPGIQLASATGTLVGGPVAAAANVIAFNGEDGISIFGSGEGGSTAEGTTVYRGNSVYLNTGLAVDLGPSGVTLNSTSDNILDFPVIDLAEVSDTELLVSGFSAPGSEIAIYLAAAEPGAEFGEGRILVATLVEGSADDLDSTTGSYGPSIDGIVVSGGTITQNRFEFHIALPDGVNHGSLLTAIAIGSVSEFSPIVTAGQKGSELVPEITLSDTTVSLTEGDTLEVSGSFFDPDSVNWTATVNYGDGSGVQPLALSLNGTFVLNHEYAVSGTYTAEIAVTDNTLATGTASITVNVANEAPTATFSEFTITSPADEGQTVTLTGEFLDGAGEHSVDVDWGDGTVTTVLVPSGSLTFTATHSYVDDSNPAGSATASDVYRVGVTINEIIDGIVVPGDETPAGLFLEEVRNVRPSSLVVNFNSTTLTEGDVLDVSGTFIDPGLVDKHTLRVDWGDGSESVIELPVGDRSFGGIPELSHLYINDPATGPDDYVVTIELWDDDEPLQVESFIRTIDVLNQVPQNVAAQVTVTSLDEGEEVLLSGTFTDAGVLDAHRVRIVWGDQSPDTVLSLPAGVYSFGNIAHTYRDNPNGAAAYSVAVHVSDYDTPDASGLYELPVQVANVRPALGQVTLSTANQSILEGDVLTVTGSYTDVSPVDTHTVTVDWGDGETTLATVDSLTRTFVAEHQYGDNGSADFGNTFAITVTVTDDSGDSDSTTLSQVVENVIPAPTIIPAAGNANPNLISLTSVVDDPGFLDTFSYAWSARPLISNPPAPQAGTGMDFIVDRSAWPNVLWQVTLTVTDDDGGVGRFSTTLLTGSDAAEEITVDATTVQSAITAAAEESGDDPGQYDGPVEILVVGLGGSDILDGSTVTDPRVSLTLDGGDDQDFLFGGSGNDTYILRSGDDAANVTTTLDGDLNPIPIGGAPTTANEGGDDSYVLVPNSTLTIIDRSGANTLSFSLADFGDDSGIRFDLSVLSSAEFTIQDVYAGDDVTQLDQHFVNTLGTFTGLTGSSYDDIITGATDALIRAGSGDDKLTVTAGTTGATIFGGADSDVLTIIGGGIDDLTFSGDDGFDLLINTGGILDLTFRGGADDDILQNVQGATIGTLSFGGDDGIDLLENFGTIADLVFRGGADSDQLQNDGAITVQVTFRGDDGSDALLNTGTIGAITFSGGADNDVLTNSGSVTGTLSFGGDDGADILGNAGTISVLTFTGGADNDILQNTGSVTASLTFGGDDGIDLLENSGSVGQLSFGGGADDDTLRNLAGAAVGSLTFTGDDGADSLLNNGSIGALSFTGGADSDVLENSGSVDGLTFRGGADDDVLSNAGTVVNTLSFEGDEGVDALRNAGAIASLVFTGGADDDLLLNQAGATVATLNFGGDNGVDALQNDGIVATLTFGGGADDDLLINNGQVTGTLTFGGDFEFSADGWRPIAVSSDDGADTLINPGSIDALIFTGGADDDLLLNQTSGLITSLSFGGDDGADALQNLGSVETLNFGGGADSDVLINSGAVTGTLNFGGDTEFVNGAFQPIAVRGDDGADILQNSGSVTTLTFTGGADDDILLNLAGGSVGNLNFGGDDGADSLQNNGAVSTLIFAGGADDDLLINRGSDITTLNFDGDLGDDILLNTGSAIGSLTFTGGADDDVLQNNGHGIVTLTFGGDDGLDVFINNGSQIGSLTFGGGADNDVLINNGESIGVIDFNGDLGNDTLIVRGSGSGLLTSAIIFDGGAGADAFQNDATGFASVTFFGDEGADALKNNASGISNLTFHGGADDDVLENNGSAVHTLVFNGDNGADILISDGDAVSGLTFSGGADNDILVNNGADVVNLTFTGDDGIDTLVNNGTGVSGLTFTGGGADDVLINTGAELTDVVFTGNAGNDRFWIQKSAVQSAQLIFHGDDGADLLINDAGGVADLTFNGGADDDGLQNNGGLVSGLTFNGGADDDVLVNTGSGVVGITFSGDSGNDSFRQSGLGVGTVLFEGGADDDLLINAGSVTTLTFGGGSDDDILRNDGVFVSALTFEGDDGSDLLVSNGPVGSLTFVGGGDDDTLQNNGVVQNLTFGGGADNDILINNGDGLASLVFHGDDGADTLINNGDNLAVLQFFGGADGDTLRTHGRGLGEVVFVGEAGGDGFHYNALGAPGSNVTFHAGPDNDFFAWRGAADNLTWDGGAGNDLAIVLGSGNLMLGGGAGDDTVQFQANPNAFVTITEGFGGVTDVSSDTLDFSAYSGGALNIDLRLTAPQVQAGQLTIAMLDGLGVENVIGTSFGDTILGNERNNILAGAQYSPGFEGPVAESRGVTQWVLLNFDTYTGAGEHIYTTEERDAITSRIENVYRGPDVGAPWFDVRVTQDINEIPQAYQDSGEYVTIWFNQTPEFGRAGGLASEIDPGNMNLGGYASVQINGLLGGVITQADIVTNTEIGDLDKTTTAMVGDEEIGANKPAATSENFVLLSSKIAAHELAHLLGLRHADSFGPIGYGLHDPPGGSGYKPVYTGPVGGVETFDHLLGSPASVGSDRFNDLNELFFGEREAVKLAWANSNPAQTNTTESTVPHSTPETAQELTLVNLAVPNTLSQGLNDSKTFFVQLQAVAGQVSIDPVTGRSESDWYRFDGYAGELLNIDVMSNAVRQLGDAVDSHVDTMVRVWYVVNGVLTPVPYYGGVAVNDDIFEPTDSSIIDLVLPQDGTYYVEVDTFSRQPGDDSYDAAVELRDELLAQQTEGDLATDELQVLEKLIDTINDTDVGSYQVVLYRFAKASSTDGIDVIKGNGGTDEVDGGPDESYELLMDLGGTGSTVEGTPFQRTIVLDDRAASDWTGSTIDYGDGSGEQPLAVDIAGTFQLSHTYGDNGDYTITVFIVDDIGQSLTQQLNVSVDNVAPTVTAGLFTIEADLTGNVLNNGTYADAGTDAVTVTASHGNLEFGNGTWTWSWDTSSVPDESVDVVITATDDDGAGSTVTFTVIVNLPPEVDLDARSTIVRGQTWELTLNATDPNPADQAGLFTFVINWGDGTQVETITGPAQLTVGHVFESISPDGVPFVVSVTATDARGFASDAANTDIAVLRWEVQDDPLHPGEQVLVIGGSDGSDIIRVRESFFTDHIRLVINEWENDIRIRANAGNSVERLAIYGQGGGDFIHVALNVGLPALIDGGAGDDFLVAGRESTILLGQEGNDQLFGSFRPGILIGGTGKDRLYGWNGSDLLIGGTTAFDHDRRALDAIMAEWKSDHSYDARRHNLRGLGQESASRKNGNYFLKINQSDPEQNTVLDDGEEDLMWGGNNIDWYLANTHDDDESKLDKLFGAKWYEVVEDLER